MVYANIAPTFARIELLFVLPVQLLYTNAIDHDIPIQKRIDTLGLEIVHQFYVVFGDRLYANLHKKMRGENIEK